MLIKNFAQKFDQFIALSNTSNFRLYKLLYSKLSAFVNVDPNILKLCLFYILEFPRAFTLFELLII